MPNVTVRAAAEGIYFTAAAAAAALAAASTIIDATAAPSVADAIPATRTKTSLDAMLLELPPEEAPEATIFNRLGILSEPGVSKNHMDWKRERGI
ncbi:hypothetical protein [Mesorhizobium wenxiniae]|nr:hypothetical protein [Mesorhizobium wenxiniae]